MSTWLTTVCTEREPDGTYEDCTWASGVMFANEREGYRAHPQTQAEYEGLRADGDDPVTPGNPGSNLTDLSRGLLKRYGWSGNILTTWAAIGSVPVGTAQVVQGLYSALPTRLRRWSKFTGPHAVCVVRIGTGWHWLDPLAPKDYAGESISTDELRAYFEGLAGAKVMTVPVGTHEEDEVSLTAVKVQRWTANGTDGALRTEPNRALTPIKAPAGAEIISYGEYKAPDGNNWRVGDWPAGSSTPMWFLRAGPGVAPDHDWIAGEILTVPAPPAPLPDCSAEVLAARHVEYARVKDGTTIAFPEPPV